MPAAGQQKWWALAALSLSMLAVGLDGTVLSVALPELSHALHATETDLQWFSSSYLLFLAAAMLPVGLLGDRYGRKKALIGSLLLFALASMACAWADSPWQFIAARSVLGVAGAGIIVMALSALTVLFTEEERPKAVGIWSAANFLALPLGPLLGGWMLTHFWWGWVFLLNAPVAVLGVLVVWALVPDSRAAERPRLDAIGALLSTAGLVGVTYGLIRAGEFGWDDAGAWVLIVAGLAVLVVFFAHQRRLSASGRRPMLDPGLFESASFTWGVILIGVVALANIGVIFAMPQYFQAVQGTDAMGSGVRLLPLIGGLVAGAVPADRIARLLGARLAVATGFAAIAAGLLLGSRTGPTSGEGFLASWMALSGFGMGLAMATATSAVLSRVPEERSGVAAGVLQAVNKVGAPLGSAVVGSVLLAAYQSHLNLGGLSPAQADETRSGVFGGLLVARENGSTGLRDSVRDSFTHGLDRGLLVSAGFALVGLVAALLFLPGRTSGPAAGAEPGATPDTAAAGTGTGGAGGPGKGRQEEPHGLATGT
ncbi:major facilitator transporter [Streptomyces albus]|uniref:Major facilitator transporter n=1 Tax=Streptomyces albus (strain ATCC 21838 / DSM 41398 / FERM P-419 / JCM 4703 / NBRC 107858) TaxID=1081613 RepID=A0A0B5F7Y8_STRA4|nr:major facilitator transporter [Streptomyces albus]